MTTTTTTTPPFRPSPTTPHPPTQKGGKREENIALLLSIQQALREAGQLRLPRLRFEGAVPESVRQVRARKRSFFGCVYVGKGGACVVNMDVHPG